MNLTNLIIRFYLPIGHLVLFIVSQFSKSKALNTRNEQSGAQCTDYSISYLHPLHRENKDRKLFNAFFSQTSRVEVCCRIPDGILAVIDLVS